MLQLLKTSFWLAGASLLLLGCVDNSRRVVGTDDVVPPGEPRDFYSITGDGRVTLHWLPPSQHDLAGFAIFISVDDLDYYLVDELAASARSYVVDGSVIPNRVPFDFVNGNTYYFGVTTFDYAGNESSLTDASTTFDTPRPFGRNLWLYDVAVDPQQSGYDFSRSPYGIPMEGQSLFADIFAERSGGRFWIRTQHVQVVELQDIGDVDFDDALAGWLSDGNWFPSSSVEARRGHVYLVKLYEESRPGNTFEPFHVAKFQVVDVGPDFVIMDWAYQVAPNNRELKAGTGLPRDGSRKREVHR